MTTVKCDKCGKEFSIDDKPEALQKWFLDDARSKGKRKCEECAKSGAKSTAKGSGKSEQVNNEKKNGYAPRAKVEITPAMLHKAYDEIKAEFADIFDEVHPFLGAWATTLVLNRTKG